MVLIRPLLRANSERKYVRHTVIFFIFAVSNVGGLLTPLGDPPLFLGFLRGVPFAWTLRLWPQWLLVVGLVLLVYMALELYYYRKEPTERAAAGRAKTTSPCGSRAGSTSSCLALVIVTVLFSEQLADAGEAIHFPFVREVILVVLALLSLKLGPRGPAGVQPLLLAAHRRGGRALRRHLRHHDPGPGAAGGQGRLASGSPSPGSTSGPAAGSRPSWTTPPPT